MEASAQPRWPEGRQDLIEWALTFLEADVMLFRSGYAKKNLLTRLRQSPLQPNDVARIEALVRRAVTQGTGVEEQRGYRRIAARLVYENHAPNLRSWLEAQAEGAVLSFNKADAAMLADIFNAPLSDEGRAKLEKGGFLLRPGWGLVLPGLTEFVRCPRGQDDVAAKRKLSAYRMLCAIRQREGSMPGPWAGKALAGVDAGR